MRRTLLHVEMEDYNSNMIFDPYETPYVKIVNVFEQTICDFRGYSTEFSMLRMLNDVYCAADGKRRSMIVLLDLSAAFNTIDIDTLLRRLEHTFGITGSALFWLKTYLEDHSQFVRIGNDRSTAVSCKFGVPQGSVLGPALFSTYVVVAPIAGVISCGVHHTPYVDDTQLYIELQKDAAKMLDSCFQAVHRWFTENGLALNPEKSEVIMTDTIQFNSDICTRQLMNITLARTAKKKTKENNKVHE